VSSPNFTVTPLQRELAWLDRETQLLQELRDLRMEVVKEYRFLPDPLREQLQQDVAVFLKDSSFGDGLEADYVLGGTHMVGVQEMTDAELVEQAYQVGIMDPDDQWQYTDQLTAATPDDVKAWLRELGHTVLPGPQ